MDTKNLERTRQDLAARLVQREIYHCASSLMSGIAQIMHDIPYKQFSSAFGCDTDEVQALFSRPDYEEAVRQFVMVDADSDELETMADEYGYWSEVLEECLPAVSEGPFDEDGDTQWSFVGNTSGVGFADEDDAREAAIEFSLTRIRQRVWELINTDEEYREVCDEYDLEPDELEVYEHWIVSDWLQRKLAERGCVTGDFAGLSIWGRCGTGQSISMDHVIRDIAADLWPDEWNGKES